MMITIIILLYLLSYIEAHYTRDAVVDSIEDNEKLVIARSYMDVPSEDGVIYVKYNPECMVNEFVDVKRI